MKGPFVAGEKPYYCDYVFLNSMLFVEEVFFVLLWCLFLLFDEIFEDVAKFYCSCLLVGRSRAQGCRKISIFDEVHFLEFVFLQVLPGTLDSYPKLKKARDELVALPSIAAFLSSNKRKPQVTEEYKSHVRAVFF